MRPLPPPALAPRVDFAGVRALFPLACARKVDLAGVGCTGPPVLSRFDDGGWLLLLPFGRGVDLAGVGWLLEASLVSGLDWAGVELVIVDNTSFP